jgi:hypothetical protein
MRRRALIAKIAGATVWPLAARAQQAGKVYRLAVLTRAGQDTDLTDKTGFRYWWAWRDEMHRLGYVEGTNLVIFRRAAQSDAQDIEELVRQTVKFAPRSEVCRSLPVHPHEQTSPGTQAAQFAAIKCSSWLGRHRGGVALWNEPSAFTGLDVGDQQKCDTSRWEALENSGRIGCRTSR